MGVGHTGRDLPEEPLVHAQPLLKRVHIPAFARQQIGIPQRFHALD